MPTVLARRILGPRLVEYRIDSHVLGRPTDVRVLLPSGYSQGGGRFPVLYLLHGGGDDFRAWTDKGEAADASADVPIIVVMPDGGRGGFYSDWVATGALGLPRWETYHLRELLPWIDSTFRTEARREGRALAGLSMGGFGAMSYAARHPDLFVAAASFSGALDNTIYRSIFDVATRRDGGPPDAIWGPWRTDGVRWHAHNPCDLAANLCGLSLIVRTGTGIPGELTPHARPDPIEAIVLHESLRFHQRLAKHGIDHDWHVGRGIHDWPYWTRDLRYTMPLLHKVFADPPAPPSRVRHTSAEPDYCVFGWHVRFARTSLEFSTLDAHVGGFTLAGSGTATVTTAPLFEPGGEYWITAGERSRRLRADSTGRIAVALRLGPPGTPLDTTVTIDRGTS